MPVDSIAGKYVCKANREVGCLPAERFQSLVLSENEEGGGTWSPGGERSCLKTSPPNKASNKQPCLGSARSGCEPLQVQGCWKLAHFLPWKGNPPAGSGRIPRCHCSEAGG